MAGELQIYAIQKLWRTQVVARLGAGGSALATTATTGFTVLPTCAGVPTGVPDSGNGSQVVDSLTGKVYTYAASAWHTP